MTSKYDSGIDSVHPDEPSYDLTNSHGLRAFLKAQYSIQDAELQPIAGGTANYVYRQIRHDESLGARSMILKHAAKHLSSNPDFDLPPERMDFEARILSYKVVDKVECHCSNAKASIADVELTKTHVHTVALRLYEEDAKLLWMEDAGNRNLLDAYQMLSRATVQEIGTEIGRWLAKLHMKTPHHEVTGVSNVNNEVGMTVARYTYNNLVTTFRQLGKDTHLASNINDTFGALIATEKESVCHGDFWPGNVMLQSNSLEEGPYILTVIDWEMVRVGSSATDVGQFAAETFMLDRFRGEKGLCSAFMRAYFDTRTAEFESNIFTTTDLLCEWMTRAAVHFAAHLAVWPARRAHWANREDTKPLFDLAVQIFEDAISGTPKVTEWRLFEGVPDLGEIERDMVELRSSS